MRQIEEQNDADARALQWLAKMLSPAAERASSPDDLDDTPTPHTPTQRRRAVERAGAKLEKIGM